ncbi:phenol hydroxylase [Halobacteriales archaeon QS_1_67_19]|nr:MAG: phenol hydroxylase [Halobacteriales archaeon QS_1_67_19]
MTDTHEVTVTSVYQMTPDVKQFVLESDGYRFEFKPGQHTQIHFEEDGEEVVRPYTSTALPGTGRLTLAIKRYPDGTASTWMHDREPGDTVEIEELGGNLYLRSLDADVVFLATGTGLTPMIPMVKQYLREGTGTARLFFGETEEEDLFYRETLDQLAADHPDFEVVYVLSEAGDDWDGPEGHVQEHLADHLEQFGGRDYYVCGVPEMVVETEEHLDERGVPDDRTYTEGWEGDEVAEE